MAYRFELSQPVAAETRRILLEQVDRAIRELTDDARRHSSVHQARKSIKRTRAILRLARRIIGEKRFKTENRRFRDIARGLSGARDKQAMIECVTKLQVRFGPDWNPRAVACVKSQLYEDRRQAEKHLANGTRGSALARLGEARAQLAGFELHGDLDDLMRGLEECYGEGRKTLVDASHGIEDEEYHEWRKWVQQHWRHMQLLSPVWPDATSARVSAARELSEILGDEHDLHVLSGWAGQISLDFTEEADMAAFVAGCEDRMRELRELATPRGSRLFAERPKAFRKRMTAYWDSAREIESDAPAAVADETFVTSRLLMGQNVFRR